MVKQFWYIVSFSLISLLLLFLGGWLTYLGIGDWYYDLNFPPFQPPPWVFTPAWVIVLTCLTLSTCIVVNRVGINLNAALLSLGLYGAQCVLNVGWSLLFFTLQRPDIALWELLVLDITLVGMLFCYGRVSRLAAFFLLPYLVWLSLSTAINLYIFLYNEFPLVQSS